MKMVTLDTLVKRINRKLKPEDQHVKKSRGEQSRRELGDFCLRDWRRNILLEKHVDVEAMARRLGVLRENEQVADEAELSSPERLHV